MKIDEKQETIIAIAETFPGMKLAQVFALVNELYRLARKIQRYNTESCNRELTEAEESRDEKAREKVHALCAAAGIHAKTNGDPRGYAIKLTLPNGRGNSPWEPIWGISGL